MDPQPSTSGGNIAPVPPVPSSRGSQQGRTSDSTTPEPWNPTCCVNIAGAKRFVHSFKNFIASTQFVNFLVAQVAALCLARLFRKSLRSASPQFRHALCLLLGLIMAYFCFGKQAIHLAVLPMVSYIVLRVVKPDIMGNLVLAVSMVYLSCLHLHRQIYHSGDYSLDITGPLMVITQRVTSLAYDIHDGLTTKTDANLKEIEALTHVRKIPAPLEFFAYTLAFQTLMCGPVIFYTDYISFIQGVPQSKESQLMKQEQVVLEPSPRRAVMYKVAGSVAAALLYLTLTKTYSLERLQDLTDPSSEISCTWSTLYVLWFAYAATLVVRCKYYHAWLLADAICNNSGMGFNGYDNNGAAKWDKLSNIDVMGFELAQNFRSAIASWNKNTNVWLRAVAYERGGAAFRTARVYALSAVWHGFYPGYYLTFLAGGIFTVTARKLRNSVRPLFLSGRPMRLLYDLLTFVTTRIAMTYATVPFVLLHLGPSLAFYGKLYYSLHFIALGAILIPVKSRRPATTSTEAHALPAISKELNGDAATHNGNTNGKLKSS